MASPVHPRPDPSPRPDPRAHADLLGGLRPLPAESPVDRLRRFVAERSMRGQGAGGAGLPGHGDDVERSLPGQGGMSRAGAARSRWLVPALVLVVTSAIGWWLLKPPGAPLDTSIPAVGPAQTTAGAGGSAVVAAAAPGGPAGAGAAPASGSEVGGSPAADTVPGGGLTDDGSVPAQLVVHASGAVASPGVYRLQPGARVDDLIRAAGGVTPEGDVDRVNLAAPLVDGERVWVPRQGEAEVPVVVAGGVPPGSSSGGAPTGSGASGSGSGSGPATPIDLNSATAEELESLPGVGPATAAAILAHREENGPFSSVDDLLEVRGIGEAKLEQIRPLVRT